MLGAGGRAGLGRRKSKSFRFEGMGISVGGAMSKPSAAFLSGRGHRPHVTEEYSPITGNDFQSTTDAPLSTFSIDVASAAYANVRRYIEQMHRLPPKDATRIEELINYFNYHYPSPTGDQPFAVHTEVSKAPWNPNHRLVHIGLKGKNVDLRTAPPSNLVFLIDVSGSMGRPNKLPLLVAGFKMLVQQLRAVDRVSIVVYSNQVRLVLPSTSGAHKQRIMQVLESLRAGGSTNGGAGIQTAYEEARRHFIPGGTNRVILATDGDFNLGITSTGELTRFVRRQRRSNIFLSVLGFGRGNYKDNRMETLSNQGNGNAYYIDNILEARKVLVKELGGTLITIAKDVKIQVEFNPTKVSRYRLIGYENRTLAAKDFNDDKKDAGELGAGHTVTALYEVVPAGSKPMKPQVDPLKYQTRRLSASARSSNELLTLKLRYKRPQGTRSTLINRVVNDTVRPLLKTSDSFRFASAVAEFGMLLRGSKHRAAASYEAVIARARAAVGADPQGYRTAFVQLVRKAQALAGVAQRSKPAKIAR